MRNNKIVITGKSYFYATITKAKIVQNFDKNNFFEIYVGKKKKNNL